MFEIVHRHSSTASFDNMQLDTNTLFKKQQLAYYIKTVATLLFFLKKILSDLNKQKERQCVLWIHRHKNKICRVCVFAGSRQLQLLIQLLPMMSQIQCHIVLKLFKKWKVVKKNARKIDFVRRIRFFAYKYLHNLFIHKQSTHFYANATKDAYPFMIIIKIKQ